MKGRLAQRTAPDEHLLAVGFRHLLGSLVDAAQGVQPM